MICLALYLNVICQNGINNILFRHCTSIGYGKERTPWVCYFFVIMLCQPPVWHVSSYQLHLISPSAEHKLLDKQNHLPLNKSNTTVECIMAQRNSMGYARKIRKFKNMFAPHTVFSMSTMEWKKALCEMGGFLLSHPHQQEIELFDNLKLLSIMKNIFWTELIT